MADHQGIAQVSTTLRKLLLERMDGPPEHITLAPPDVEVAEMTGERLNIYLYQVSRNDFLSNQEIPGDGHPSAYGFPPLSLNLFYLITAYGSSDVNEGADLCAQQILGDAMLTLHDISIIDDESLLAETGLANEFEKLKITLQPQTIDDLSKLWSAMADANFRRSVTYEVSVVQIASQRMRRFPRLVGEPPAGGPRVYVSTLRSPCIRDVRVQRPGDGAESRFPYARVGDTLHILGSNLLHANTRVMLGDVDATIAVIQDQRIEVEIPDDDALQPGQVAVRVVHDVLLGDPSEARPWVSSNVAGFILVPRIDSITPATLPDPIPNPLPVTIVGKRLIVTDRENLTLVGEQIIPADEYTTATDELIEFDLDGVTSGEYAVRVRANGAESIETKTLK